MNSKLLDYIILALIFVIAINIFTKIFGRKCLYGNENMINNNASIVNVALQGVQARSNEPQPVIAPVLPTSFVTTTPIHASISESVPKAFDCASSSNNESASEEVKSITHNEDYASFNSVETNKQFSKEDLSKYRNQMYDLYEQVNTSSAGVDTVDKINYMYTAGNSDLSSPNTNGKTISDIYTGLTQDIINRKNQCVNKDCLIPPTINGKQNENKFGGYIRDTGFGKYLRHGLMYEDDDVETGAKFFGDIEGDDEEFEKYAVYS